MNWGSNRGRARGAAAAALTVALAGTAVAGPVVVRSTGPSARAYPAGRQLADNAQLALKAGDTIVLLDSRGTRTLNGPGSYSAVGTGARVSAAQTASRILANQSASERRGGAVRGGTPTGAARSPNLWFVDLSKSGTVCVADPNAVRVWRASGANPTEVKITAPSGSGSVTMPQGATVGDWPRSLPVTSGTEYVVATDGMAPAKIKFVTVPMPTSLEDTASQLIAKGCTTQLDLLIAQTSGSGTTG
jgi:hypothetical protein